MACSGAYADANDWAAHWCVSLDSGCEAQLNRFLEIAATPIHAALAASNQCSCTPAAWAAEYLIYLNCIVGATMYRCPCSGPSIANEERAALLTYATDQLAALRDGRLEICAGETGSEFPALEWAETATTEFEAAQIIYNAQLRST